MTNVVNNEMKMGRFSKLLQNKGKDVKIGEDTFNIKPLTGDSLGLFMDIDETQKEQASFKMIQASLNQTDETITLDDIKELPLNEVTKLMEVISEVNELK